MRTNYEDQVAELRELGAEFGSMAATRERSQRQIESLSSQRFLGENEQQTLASAESTMRNTEERFEQLSILLPAHAEEVRRLQTAYQDLANNTGDGHFLGGDDFDALL
jgi:chromosome segregation ATPase